MSDPAALRALIEAERPQLVVPEIEAIATPVLEEMEAAGLVRVHPDRARRAADDGPRRHPPPGRRDARACRPVAVPLLRLAGRAAGRDRRRHRLSVHRQAGDERLSGKGQSKIDGPDDVQKAWDYAMAGGRVARGRVIVEGFIDFDYEITLLTVRALGRRRPGRRPHFCEPIGHVQVSRRLRRELAAASDERRRRWTRRAPSPRRVTDDLGGTAGLFGVELFVKGDQVWFSEVSPRPHDTGMVTMATQWQSEFELHARAILGLPVDTDADAARAPAP
ncbi:MAG: ATP-grasp domain-containing protein [Comamonadaceae bacterium]|nr:ATP-grasp domain-containing protein [Comamonadaceae bacterium]